MRSIHHIALPRPLAIYGLILAVASAAVPASAQVHFDFEGGYLVDPGHSIKDHCLVQVGEVWHCFYIRGDAEGSTVTEDALGHAVSTDLKTWSLLPPALFAGPETWDDRNVWAPHILEHHPNDPNRRVMFYTGADALVVQRMGVATTVNPELGSWTKSMLNPHLEPDSPLYEWSPAESFSSFRDPFYYFHAGQHHLLHTVQMDGGSVRGAIHHVVSDDFDTWVDVGPLFIHNGPPSESWHDLESVQLHYQEGYWHLFFSEFSLAGVRYLRSSEMDSGWDINGVSILDLGTAAEITTTDGGEFLFSRHAATIDPTDDSLFWVIRIDHMSFDGGNQEAQKLMWDPLADDWPQRSGTAFLAAPTFGDNSAFRGQAPTGPVGHGYLSTYEFYAGPLSGKGAPGSFLGSGATGTMKSRTFVITGIRMDLLVGGGDDPDCFIALVDASDDSILRIARGHGSQELLPVSWDLVDLQGRSAYLWVEDGSTSTQGYINVDDIREIPDPVATPPVSATSISARLLTNVPNPFNPRTLLRVELDEGGAAELSIYDTRGRRVRNFPTRHWGAGTHSQMWDGRDDEGGEVASGSYRLRLAVDGRFVDSRPLTLIR